MQSKVAIIGSNGFLAQYITKKLRNDGAILRGFGRLNKNENIDDFITFDYPNYPIDFEDLLPFDAIIYTAGAGIQANLKESTASVFYLNAFLPIDLLLFLENSNWQGKIITFGSYFEIGFNSQHHFFSESEVALSANLVPNDYCNSKRLLTRFYSNKPLKLNYYHLILPNIYGLGENEQRLIPYLVNNIQSGDKISLTSGEQTRQYIHAQDVADFVAFLIENDAPKGMLNIAQPEAITVKDLVLKTYQLLHKIPPQGIFGQTQRTDASMNILLLDTSKITQTLNWTANISLESGILSYLG
jgi:nucleoside-diphosphate-sugar epimerase